MALCVVVVVQVAMRLKIEWDIAGILRNWNDMLAKRVCDAGLIEDVRVLAGEITNNDEGSVDQREHVLNDYRMVPYVINPLTLHPVTLSRLHNRSMDSSKTCAEWHHDR